MLVQLNVGYKWGGNGPLKSKNDRAEKDSVIGKSRSLSNIYMRCGRERVSSRVSDGLARYVSYFPVLDRDKAFLVTNG